MMGLLFLKYFILPDVIYTHRSEKQMRGDNKGVGRCGKPANAPLFLNHRSSMVMFFYFYELQKPKNLWQPVFKY